MQSHALYSFCMAAFIPVSKEEGEKRLKGGTYNIRRLHMVFILLNLFLQLVEGDLLILNYQVDLELLDTKADGDELGSTPDKAVLVNSPHVLFKLSQVRLMPMASSRVTIDFAAGLALPAFFLLYSAKRSSLIFAASASSSSSSEPKRSTSSSSSSAWAFAWLTVTSEDSGP